MWSLRVWFATFRLHTASFPQAMRSIEYANLIETSRSTFEVTTSWDKQLYFSFEVLFTTINNLNLFYDINYYYWYNQSLKLPLIFLEKLFL